MNKKKIVIFALIALAIVAYFQFGLGQYLNLDALKAQHRRHSTTTTGNTRGRSPDCTSSPMWQ